MDPVSLSGDGREDGIWVKDHLFLYMEKCNLNVSEIHTEVFKVIKSLFSHKPEHKNISVLVIL